jgi:hypothetical protein
VHQHALQPVPPDDLDMFDEIYEHYLDQAITNEVVVVKIKKRPLLMQWMQS